jgi:hypothetical protein
MSKNRLKRIVQNSLEYLVNSGTLDLQTRRKMADSDPRHHVLMRVHQGVTPVGVATVSETVSKPASAITIRHYSPLFAIICQYLPVFASICQYLLKLAKTRVRKRG